jgi:hypothetical protein
MLPGTASGASQQPQASSDEVAPAVAMADAPVDSAATDDCSMCIKRRPWVAAGEVVFINVMANLVSRVYDTNQNGNTNFTTWGNNFKYNFEWDANRFYTNFFEHPIAGTGFYNAARSNGMNLWESTPYTMFGSLLSEFFVEVNRPAANDVITTTLGGVSLGEALWRLSSVVLDNEDTGLSRVARETGAFILNPIRGLNRLMYGHMTSVGPNRFERKPERMDMRLNVGARRVSSGNSVADGYDNLYFGFQVDYGDVLARNLTKPFQAFWLDSYLHHSSERFLGGVKVTGSLYAGTLNERHDGQARHKFLLALDYDFVENEAYRFGQNSIDAGIVSGWGLSDAWSVRTTAALQAVPFGAVSNDIISETVYDYGLGAGMYVEAQLLHKRSRTLVLSYENVWLTTIHGRYDSHRVQFATARLRLPVFGRLGLGVDGIVFRSDNYSSTIRNSFQRHPELRVYTSWRLD